VRGKGTTEGLWAALNFELPGGEAPEWVMMVPAGPVIEGRDGRSWNNDDPGGVVAAFRAEGRDLPLDWEHSTELLAPEGRPAPAAAWIKEMEVREGGSIWARLDWTPKGAESVANREYRYISPVFIYDRETRRILRIPSAALTNRPNVRLGALNHYQPDNEEEVMLKKLLARLGLPEDADEATALNAVQKLQTDLAAALNRSETPSLDKFVPRADYDAATARAVNAEQKLKEKETAELEGAIAAEVDAAVKAGKVTPATRDYYVAMCRQEGGLAEFKKFAAAAPVIGGGSALDGRRAPEAGTGTDLNAEIAAMFGNTVEDIKKYGRADG